MHRPPLDAAFLRRSVAQSPESSSLFSGVDVVESTGSTNADLMAHADDPDAAGRVLLAECQRSGRGRHERSWSSPPRSQVSMSILVRLPGIDPAVLGWLPLLSGVATVDAVRAATGLRAQLKWPNDVLVEGRKIAGILSEVVAGAAVPIVVIGTGLNVSMTEDELPVPHATSLVLAGAPDVDRTVLVEAMLHAFAHHFVTWRDGGWDTAALADEYRARCATLGAEVRAELPGGVVVTGTATDVDEHGRLLIGDRAVSAGDVTHLRAEY